MAPSNVTITESLPGIVTDQPEIYESEPIAGEETGVSEIDNLEPNDEAIGLIEVPIKQAFSYFASRENEIAKFYVQKSGEYKISGEKPDEETDIEKYHRLVSEVNGLLNKFQAEKVSKAELSAIGSLDGPALTNNLEVMSKQLKALQFAAEDGSINPSLSEFATIKSKLNNLKLKVDSEGSDSQSSATDTQSMEPLKLVRMGAFEKRLNQLETILGDNENNLRTLLNITKCDSLSEAAETLGSWLSMFKPDNLQRVNREIDFLTQKLEKLHEQQSMEEIQADLQNKAKIDQLFALVTATDKHRAMVPTLIHRLNAMEELQQKAAQVTTTVNHLEQIQAQIADSLQSNKNELTSLNEMFATNMEMIKEFSKDIDARIATIQDKDD